jgi:hypothetical protein
MKDELDKSGSRDRLDQVDGGEYIVMSLNDAAYARSLWGLLMNEAYGTSDSRYHFHGIGKATKDDLPLFPISEQAHWSIVDEALIFAVLLVKDDNQLLTESWVGSKSAEFGDSPITLNHKHHRINALCKHVFEAYQVLMLRPEEKLVEEILRVEDVIAIPKRAGSEVMVDGFADRALGLAGSSTQEKCRLVRHEALVYGIVDELCEILSLVRI